MFMSDDGNALCGHGHNEHNQTLTLDTQKKHRFCRYGSKRDDTVDCREGKSFCVDSTIGD